MSDLGKLIREHRKKVGLTQQQLAKLAKVSQQTITALENGRIRRTTRLPEILLILEIDMTEFVRDIDNSLIKLSSLSTLTTNKDLNVVSDSVRFILEQKLAQQPTFQLNKHEINNIVTEVKTHLAEQLTNKAKGSR